MEGQYGEGQDPGIYSPKVRLFYTPPAALPAPFPKTLHIEGFPLYLTSSGFIRHTLNALYSDLSITLSKLSSPPSASSPSSTSRDSGPGKQKKISRDKSVILSMTVLGTSRMSGSKAQWDIKCTYTFSPISGLILSHAVDEIDPAPHMTAYEALRLALGMRWIGAGSGAAAQTAVSTPATGGGGAGAVVRAKVD
ncbi:hypothetical protein BDV98DRAFT_535087 [Pterulicium gracile]|uniref:Uncharacterized protein n=1 Tax=Pterulicium gracile TaxID=1884261 RepID=A0A5C3Q7K3_9AGAR|nr:hypothetical protein BDV98DRAFT_535087 [Pterula gracilis]